MKKLNLDFYFDDNLQEVFVDPAEAEAQIQLMLGALPSDREPLKKASALGEVGAYLRILRRLEEAEQHLLAAIQHIQNHKGGQVLLTIQQLRLAHVYQWQRDFDRSNELMDEILKRLDTYETLRPIFDFIWQHAGKNYFDQMQYSEALAAFEKALQLRIAKKSPIDQIESTQKAILETQTRLIAPAE